MLGPLNPKSHIATWPFLKMTSNMDTVGWKQKKHDISPYSTRNRICVGIGYQTRENRKQTTRNSHDQCEIDQRKLYSTLSCWGLRWVHLLISQYRECKIVALGPCIGALRWSSPTRGPNVKGFAFWWNIGFSLFL